MSIHPFTVLKCSHAHFTCVVSKLISPFYLFLSRPAAHWRYTASARMTRPSTSASLRTVPDPRRPVLASPCSGPTACPACPPMSRRKPCHPPLSGCPGRSPIRTLRTSSATCSTSAGRQVSLNEDQDRNVQQKRNSKNKAGKESTQQLKRLTSSNLICFKERQQRPFLNK